jgi:hypothetical protein
LFVFGWQDGVGNSNYQCKERSNKKEVKIFYWTLFCKQTIENAPKKTFVFEIALITDVSKKFDIKFNAIAFTIKTIGI